MRRQPMGLRGPDAALPTLDPMDRSRFTRRRLIEGAAVVPFAVALAACGSDDGELGATDGAGTTTTQTQPDGSLAATPACDDHGDATPEQTEGPYFTPDSPERNSLLESGVRGERMVVTG